MAGSPTVGGGGATAGTGGSATGGASAGSAGKAGGGAGMGGASGGSGGASGGSGGASGGSGGAKGGSGGASGGSGGAKGGSGGASGGSGGGGGTGNVGTFAQVTQILGTNCAKSGCHSKGNGQHMEFHAEGLYERLTTPMMKGDCMNVTLVKASDAAGSFLNGIVRQGMGGCGTMMISRMPKNCSDSGPTKCLSSMDLQTIESWINAGAKQ